MFRPIATLALAAAFMAAGALAPVARVAESYTGQFLKKIVTG